MFMHIQNSTMCIYVCECIWWETFN